MNITNFRALNYKYDEITKGETNVDVQNTKT